MYIENPKQKLSARQNQRTKIPPTHSAPNPQLLQRKEPKLIEESEQYLLSQHSQDVLLHWRAPEFEVYEKDRRWYFGVSLALTAIVAWAVYSNSPIMAITFILIGVVGYIYLQKEPRVLDFMITHDGIVAGKELYEFENLTSFWIFYEPEGEKIISLKTKSHLSPIVHIPIHNENPAEIRQALLDFILEEKQEPGAWDIFERILHF